MELKDSAERLQATDPALSFIVQAPAGSGKTEILTQRYLRLLSRVTHPEHILALTFTRKAAREMRERILLALKQAETQQEAGTAHQQLTLNLAKKALMQSQKYQWDLLQQPNRLGICTIDALCQRINQAIPILEQSIAYANISNKPDTHYLNAARACLGFALNKSEYQQAISTLLIHVDNRQDKLLHLLAALLAKRDLWLNPLFQARNQDRATFEQGLKYIEQHELERFQKSLSSDIANELTALVRDFALVIPNASWQVLEDWDHFETSTAEEVRALSKLLLTGDRQFRKAFDHHLGLKKELCSDDDYKRFKTQSKSLLETLEGCTDFLASLIQVSDLPSPRYEDHAWEVLQALFLLLPVLVGHLQLEFQEKNTVDFTNIAQQAHSALGDLEQPTDLALYLDYTLHHILVDEFQDTSMNQFELITKLVQGWQMDEGKTLFIVGDPMQSIYRFRQAEVGLFFRAKAQGIGPITLNFLELQANFRSTSTVVKWVNTHFSYIFPKCSDIESGAVNFHPSQPVIPQTDASTIIALSYASKTQEAQGLIQLVKQELDTNPNQSLAILVRSRTHLAEIIKLLKAQKIPYQGTDIDLLAHVMHVRDMWSLTQALLYPANRLAWLSVLRSPYCGVSLKDLHAIACFNKQQSIYYALLHLEQIKGLSEDGRLRAQFCMTVMAESLRRRYQKSLSHWVEDTAKALQAKNFLTPDALEDLEQFWFLLDTYEKEGRLEDQAEFVKELNKLYSQQSRPAPLQIMTIHKSKGLEFDTVFLPQLGAQPNKGDNPMLRWLKLPTQTTEPVFLVSPLKASDKEVCALYDYLGALDEEKNRYEAQRLLYVAVTRAKSRLYLLDSSTKTAKNSFKNLLKHQEFLAQDQLEDEPQVINAIPQRLGLPLSDFSQPKSLGANLGNPAPKLSSSIPRLVGVVGHYMLQWICEYHPQHEEDLPWDLARREFETLGFDELLCNDSISILKKQISNLFSNPKGKWIIQAHKEERNEYQILVQHQGRVQTRIIDRMFIEHDRLWIIDFKTGKEDEANLLSYQQQLNDYASFLDSKDQEAIHCGLYYLASGKWLEWQFNHNN